MDINSGQPWSEMDLSDLKDCLRRGDSVAEIANFLCRDEEEVRAKIEELNLFDEQQTGS